MCLQIATIPAIRNEYICFFKSNTQSSLPNLIAFFPDDAFTDRIQERFLSSFFLQQLKSVIAE